MTDILPLSSHSALIADFNIQRPFRSSAFLPHNCGEAQLRGMSDRSCGSHYRDFSSDDPEMSLS